MLSKEEFIAGITALKKVYIGWQFDMQDDIQLALWYSPFKNLTDDQFNWVIKEYYNHNKKPPACITDLTDILVNVYYNRAKIKPEKALGYVRNVISDCGGWEYGGKAEIYKRLAKYPPLHKTVKEFEDTIKNMSANDTYAADRFRRAYEDNLKDYATEYTNKRLGLALPPGDKQALGSGTLPYEQ